MNKVKPQPSSLPSSKIHANHEPAIKGAAASVQAGLWTGHEDTVPFATATVATDQDTLAERWQGGENTSALPLSDFSEPVPRSLSQTLSPTLSQTLSQTLAHSLAEPRSIPNAHLHLTEQFALFSGRARGKPSVKSVRPATGKPATDTWHHLGRSGALSGQVFGDYEIGAILGEGGMGIIYRARQRSLARRVAVKTLAGGMAHDAVQRGRFELEARAAGLIRSPHVVQVYAAGSYNDIAYFVMEFIDGTHLGEIIAEHLEEGCRLAPVTVAEWVLHAARGLAAAAEHGIVHRDIKPSNLLITLDRVVKIADFGISKMHGQGDLTRTGMAIGTPSYVSPEQGRGEECDQRADIYSLGVVFYELLTNLKPFVGETSNAVIYQHNYAEPRLPREIDPDIPEHYQAITLKCLQKDPAKRYQTASELIADLERIEAGNLSITAIFTAKYGTGADDAMRRYVGRGRRWLAPTLVGGLTFTAALLGGLWWWQTDAGGRAEQRRQLAELRSELRVVLDAAVPVPPSAGADVDRLANGVGGQDADILRWRRKLTQVGDLTASLARLDEATLAGATLFGKAQADLNALVVLVGDQYPGIDRWRSKLQSTAAESADLRQQLGMLDQVGEVTLAQHEAVAARLGRFTSLAGDKDADLLRWRARIAATDERLALLKTALLAYDDLNATRTVMQARQLAAQLDEYIALRGPDQLDEDGSRWQQRLGAERQRLEVLRGNLAPLDQGPVLSESTQARLAGDLLTYQGHVEEHDADLLRWQRKLAEAGRTLSALRTSLTALDHPDQLSGEQLRVARRDLEMLRPLVGGDEPQVTAWSTALSQIEHRLQTHRRALAVLDQAADVPISRVQQLAAAAAIVEFDRRQMLAEESKILYRKRLISEAERIAELHRDLAVAVVPDLVITPGLVDQVLLYGRLAGNTDADFLGWYGRVVRAVQLREALSPLNAVGPIPERARELLGEYTAIVGADAMRVHQWRAKLDHVAELRRVLSPLDRVAPAPPDGQQRLAELVGLIGNFPGADEWQTKLVRINQLIAELGHELSPTAVRLALTAQEHLALLGALVGADEPHLREWSKRLAYLIGPGQPPWATAYAVDAAGPKASLRLPGNPEVLVEFRYIPPGQFVMGSPLDEPGRDADEAEVQVNLTAGYWLGVQECRQDMWQRVMQGNPSLNPDPEQPVQRVAWTDVQDFLKRFNELVPAFNARLPTEAEWEHAARAGDSGAWQGPRGAIPSAEVHQISWYRGATDDSGTHASGRRQPNALGLQDTLGNVWEWCADRYGMYSPVPVVDPLGFESELRVARGGSWGDRLEHVRVANRVALPAHMRSSFLGFRLAGDAALPPDVHVGSRQEDEVVEQVSPTIRGASSAPE